MARIAKSLDALRAQINQRWPNRSKASDGWIGDPAHAARKSDHNPNAADVVQALDVTNDPKSGPDAAKLAEALRVSKDKRIKYLISNKRMASSYATGGAMPWAWRPYTGTNPHDKHCHISVSDTAALYDNPQPWDLSAFGVVSAPPDPPDATKLREKMGRIIIGYEYSGDLKETIVSDGSHEIAGVNETYHPDKFAELKAMVDVGNQTGAYSSAAKYTMDYTAIAAEWVSNGATEFYLRDCIYNRGPTGAAKILQRAVGVPIDGAVGPQTKAAARALTTDDLLKRLRTAREAYERTLPRTKNDTKLRDESWSMWRGMVNRWDKALADAAQFKGLGAEAVVIATGGAVIAGGSAAAASQGFDWTMIIPFVVIAICVLGIIVFLVRKRK